MKCPECNAWSTVLETRTRADGSRRRTFLCGNEHKFNSIERIEEVKHGGGRTRSLSNEDNTYKPTQHKI